jgi:hypothetical protein
MEVRWLDWWGWVEEECSLDWRCSVEEHSLDRGLVGEEHALDQESGGTLLVVLRLWWCTVGPVP